MDSCYVRIEGMQWDSARRFVRSLLVENNDEVHDVTCRGSIAHIFYTGEPRVKDWIGQINGSGVLYTRTGLVTRHDPVLVGLVQLLAILGVLWVIYEGVLHVAGVDVFSSMPAIDSTLSLGALFVTGVLTSVHCMAMCGALNLVTALSQTRKPTIGAMLYNIGRISSYTITGFIAGAIGSVVTVSPIVSGIALVVAGLFMMVIALNFMGILHLRVFTRLCNPARAGKNAFAVGLLNGLMPCGPLQAMQIYALSTGSPWLGALSTLAFGLGTVPLMFGVGVASSFFKSAWKGFVVKVAAVLIMVFSIAMMGRGLVALGVTPDRAAASAAVNGAATATSASSSVSESQAVRAAKEGYVVATIDGDHQVVETELGKKSFGDIAVYAGLPIEFHIHASADNLTSCNQGLHINGVGTSDVEATLAPGDNVIEFTADEPGDYTYSCWMDMIVNRIRVMER